MERRSFIKTMMGMTSRPNFLFLLTDDQRADLMGCAGHPILKTPNIDQLSSDGVRFVNNFCTTSICCTSRASIFLGLYEKTHKISDFHTHFSQKQVQLSYPYLLRQAGFKTGFVGKYGVGSDAAPRDLFDITYGEPGPEVAGQSRDFAKKAIDFLGGVRRQESFCLSVSFRAPHANDASPQQYLYDPEEAHLYKNQAMPFPPRDSIKKFEESPDFIKESESRLRWNKRFSNNINYQESVRSYYRLISGVDYSVGEIIRALKRLGLFENTVVIFSSDNGYFLGERGLADKWYPYEKSIRTPLIIMDPRLKNGFRSRICMKPTLNIDISPTILSMGGVSVPECVQGKNIYPLIWGGGRILTKGLVLLT